MKEFERIIGYDDVKIELERIADMMKDPEKYKALGVKTTKGLLLHGEPGVGKTLMAKCLIKASGRKAFTIRKDIPDGEFVKYIKETFEKAKKVVPSIVFLDDLDKFANDDSYHKNSEEYVTVQSCIDECKDSEVFVLATANNTDAVPKSLLRPGRFDRSITVDCPKGEDAEKIIRHYLRKKKCSKDVDYKEIARLLDGDSCATLETVVNEAGVYAGFENRNEISMHDLTRSFMRLMYDNPEKTEFRDDKYLLQAAYHEAGHTVVAETLEPESVRFVTVKPYNSQLGGFAFLDENSNYYCDTKFMENKAITLLAGKAATETVYGTTDTGAIADIQMAYETVEPFLSDYCISGFDTFSYENRKDPEQQRQTRMTLISAEMERYYREARRILIENRTWLDVLAKELFEKKVLIGKDIQRIKQNIKGEDNEQPELQH